MKLVNGEEACHTANDNLIDFMITHCRQGVTNAADARRIDQVFINNGNGTYTQDVTNWTILVQKERFLFENCFDKILNAFC